MVIISEKVKPIIVIKGKTVMGIQRVGRGFVLIDGTDGIDVRMYDGERSVLNLKEYLAGYPIPQAGSVTGYCPKCGKPVKSYWNYCPMCGAELPK